MDGAIPDQHTWHRTERPVTLDLEEHILCGARTALGHLVTRYVPNHPAGNVVDAGLLHIIRARAMHVMSCHLQSNMWGVKI